MAGKDESVWNQTRQTSWARVELYGDTDDAARYIPTARVVLGQLRTFHGVNERRAQGEAGGFFHRMAHLPDGTRIQAITNDGHDTVRIYPSTVVEEDKRKRPEKEFDPRAYLWVGVRAVGTYKWYSLDTFMVEPDTSSDGLRGCIGPGNSFSGWVDDSMQLELLGDALDVRETMTPGVQGSLDGLLDHFQTWETGVTDSHNGLQAGLKQRGQHCFAAFVFDGAAPPPGSPGASDSSTVYFSANGLMLSDFTGVDPSSYWLHPLDPQMSDAQNRGEQRDFSGRSTGAPDNSHNGWDQVFWIDPFDYLQEGDFDDRPEMMAVTDHLRTNGYIKEGDDQILSGKYQLVVQCFDSTPQTVSSRAGADIPSATGFFRAEFCDYVDYDTETGGSSLQVEVEVRIGRATMTEHDDEDDQPGTQTPVDGSVFNFTLNCSKSDDRNCVTTPLGWSTVDFDACSGDGGLNMAGPSFSQCIEIDVENQTAELTTSLPKPFFGVAAYQPPVQQKRYPARIYVYGAVFPATDDAHFATYAGAAIYKAMEAMTSGSYGCSLMREISAGEITALIAGAGGHFDHIYRFDPDTHAVQDVGTYDGVVVDEPAPPRDANFDWFYRLAIQDQNNCMNTMGIVVISTGESFFEGTQNYQGWPGHNDSLDCCTEAP